MGCRSSLGSLSGREGGVEPVEPFAGEMFSRGDSAAPDLVSGSVEAPSLVCDELRGLPLGERAGLLAPDRPPGRRPRP